ncbi:MAG: hypothetical protein PWR04_965 [Anaerophaga sp.]|nr:hypothetical protein [Anaerophaga sp.]
MNLPSFSEDDLRKASKREDLIRETAQQIIKDFTEFDLAISFSGNIHDFYQELFVQMQQHVAYLLTEKTEKFLNLLYRIDVDISDIESYQIQVPEVPFYSLVTELIIHRELRKVLMRDFFRRSGR